MDNSYLDVITGVTNDTEIKRDGFTIEEMENDIHLMETLDSNDPALEPLLKKYEFDLGKYPDEAEVEAKKAAEKKAKRKRRVKKFFMTLLMAFVLFGMAIFIIGIVKKRKNGNFI